MIGVGVGSVHEMGLTLVVDSGLGGLPLPGLASHIVSDFLLYVIATAFLGLFTAVLAAG